MARVSYGSIPLYLLAGGWAPRVEKETHPWYQQQIEFRGTKGRLWVSLNQGWKLWQHQELIREGNTSWPNDDCPAQLAMMSELQRAIHEQTWRSFSTRIEVAARHSNTLFGCYASVIRGEKVYLPATLDDRITDDLQKAMERSKRLPFRPA